MNVPRDDPEIPSGASGIRRERTLLRPPCEGSADVRQEEATNGRSGGMNGGGVTVEVMEDRRPGAILHSADPVVSLSSIRFRMTSLLHIDLRRLARRMLLVILGGLVTGTIVYLIRFGFRWRPDVLLWSFLIGVIYVAVILSTVAGTGAFVSRRLLLDSKRAVAIRALTHAAAMVASFLAATAIVEHLLDVPLSTMGNILSIIGMVSTISMLGSAIVYLEIFHNRLRRAEQSAIRAELQALRAKIDPHFLFNSLNSIAALIRSDPARAENVTESLADLFRYSLDASSRPSVTLAEEIESVEIYLVIERARFGERLQVAIDIGPEIRSARVPSLLLQPLVENAVRHGVGRTDGICEVVVQARCEEGSVRLRVTDSGPGFSSTDRAIVMARGTGLANVAERLHYQFGERARLAILRNGVELLFPFDADSSQSSKAFLHDPSHHRP
jgi:signal transduction histidine kinase